MKKGLKKRKKKKGTAGNLTRFSAAYGKGRADTNAKLKAPRGDAMRGKKFISEVRGVVSKISFRQLMTCLGVILEWPKALLITKNIFDSVWPKTLEALSREAPAMCFFRKHSQVLFQEELSSAFPRSTLICYENSRFL